jgi:hypothetical protein
MTAEASFPDFLFCIGDVVVEARKTESSESESSAETWLVSPGLKDSVLPII